jgi:hypothetical protein
MRWMTPALLALLAATTCIACSEDTTPTPAADMSRDMPQDAAISRDDSVPELSDATPDAAPDQDAPDLTVEDMSADAAPDADMAGPSCELGWPGDGVAECADASATTLPGDGFGVAGPHPVEVVELGVVKKVTVYLPQDVAKAPVLFFSHAFGARDPSQYDATFRVLASQGLAVVQVPYATVTPGVEGKDSFLQRYDELFDGFLLATTSAQTRDRLELTKVGFVGHSFGGGASPELARRGFVEHGWGSQGRFFFAMAPWYSWGTGYDTIPADTKMVVQVYQQDVTNSHCISAGFWDQLPAAAEKRWQVVQPDVCACALPTAHGVPFTAAGLKANEDNGLDVWAVRRRIHALAAYAFEGDLSAKPIGLGDDAAMGDWVGCGGRAVAPMVTTMAPTDSGCDAQSQFRCECRDEVERGEPCPDPS